MQREDSSMVHEGRNVKRIREILGIKQEALAMDLGISQQAVSALEQKEALDREVLEKVAKALKVAPDAIKNFNEEATFTILSNVYHDQSASVNYYCNINPVEKWIEAIEENKRLYQEQIDLYERMLKDKTELIEKLEQILLLKK